MSVSTSTAGLTKREATKWGRRQFFDPDILELLGFFDHASMGEVVEMLARVRSSGEGERIVTQNKDGFCVVVSAFIEDVKAMNVTIRHLMSFEYDLRRDAWEGAKEYVVCLVDAELDHPGGGMAATVEYETDDKAEALAWLDEWMEDPIGLVPVVLPVNHLPNKAEGGD